MKKIQIKKVNADVLKSFIESLKPVTNSIHINMDSEYFYAQVHDDGKVLSKVLPYSVADVFEFKKKLPEGLVRMAFSSPDTISSSMKHLTKDNLQAEIFYTEENGQYLASELDLFDKKMRFRFFCADPTLGDNELDNETLEMLVDTSYAAYDFALMAPDIESIKSTNTLDKTEKEISICADSKGAWVKSNFYEIILDEECENNGDEEKRLLKKEHFLALDKGESYQVYVCPQVPEQRLPGKAVFMSKDSQSIVVMAFASSPTGE